MRPENMGITASLFPVSPQAWDSLHRDDSHIIYTEHNSYQLKFKLLSNELCVEEARLVYLSTSTSNMLSECMSVQTWESLSDSQQTSFHQTGILLHFCYDSGRSKSCLLARLPKTKTRFWWILPSVDLSWSLDTALKTSTILEKQSWAMAMFPSIVTGINAVSAKEKCIWDSEQEDFQREDFSSGACYHAPLVFVQPCPWAVNALSRPALGSAHIPVCLSTLNRSNWLVEGVGKDTPALAHL